MKIRMFEMEKWECEPFRRLGDENELRFHEERLDTDSASDYSDTEILSVFIYSDLSADTLREMPELRLIATRSTGFDHIDLDYAREHGITVCNVPAYGDNTVAEHVFALLLALSHRVVEAVDRTRRGDFGPQGLTGFDLRGRTLGVVGTGRIGLHTASIARGFGMDVLGYDLEPDEEAARRIGFRYVELDELLGASDVVSLHVPGNENTRHLLSEREFGLMREGSVLINTSRGSVVHIQPLLRALAEGKLAGAGLDVLPEEPVILEEAELLRRVYQREHDLSTLLADHVLLHMNNVVITPHSAFNTAEAVRQILEVTRANIRNFLEGTPANTVTG